MAHAVRWLGMVEVDDGRRHFGAALYCEVDAVAEEFTNAETAGIGSGGVMALHRPWGSGRGGAADLLNPAK